MRVRDMLEDLVHDLRLAGRQLRKAPAFTAIATLTLALGIGANTAIFSVVHHLLLAPLPYPDGDRIVALGAKQVDGSFFPIVGGPLLDAWRQRARSVEAFGTSNERTFQVPEASAHDSVVGSVVSPEFVGIVGARPIIGRGFLTTDANPDAPAVAMISSRLWRQSFGSRREIIGSTLHVSGRPYTVVGVTDMHAELPRPRRNDLSRALIPWSVGKQPDVWVAQRIDVNAESVGDLFAKLRAGVTPDRAALELDAIMHSVPDSTRNRGVSTGVMRSQDFLEPKEVRAIQVLFLAVGVLLLIACVNVANLLLARAWSRRRELAIRMTLGAGRGRIVRQILTESLTLAFAGGALGLLLASQGLRAIIAVRSPALEHLAEVRLERGVLLWSLSLSLATGVLFSLAPALFASARSANDALRGETRGASGSTAARRSRSALVVAEVALSLVLLVGAGLLVRAFLTLQRAPLGFAPSGLVSVGVFTPPRAVPADLRQALREATLERLRAVPGVVGVSVGTMPGVGMIVTADLEVENNTAPRATGIHASTSTFANADYFRVAGIPLIAGRLFDSTSASEQNELVINRSLAQKLWPNGNAVGSRMRLYARSPWKTVVGIVGDVRIPGVMGGHDEIQTYGPPIPQVPTGAFLVRTSLPADVIAPTLQKAIASVDTRLRVSNPTTGDGFIREALAPARFAMTLLVVFSVVALALAMIGLYGVVAYTVTQRTREIGIRVALGAQRRAITRLVVGDGIRLVMAGLVIGLAAAAAAAHVLGSMLYGMSPADPVTYAAVALLVVGIALVASYAPTRRALRIDPTEALRDD
ncbi:MAG TPA: ADOP family duplicated permease [Gemmatimonadaceae bacterium]|nr:ADOP family duplicated permease [Gemmatimonadaceae bacterium]